MECQGWFIPNLRKKLEKNQKNFKILLAFLWGLSYNKYTEVVKSGVKCLDVVKKSIKIGEKP